MIKEQSVVRILRDTPIARLTLARIGSRHVAALRDAWQAEGYAAATIARRLAVLSHVYAVAARDWNMAGLVNPALAVEKPTIANASERRVSDAEIDAICTATGSAELAALIRLAVETAMRRGELCALRWEHINLADDGVAHLPHTKNGHARACRSRRKRSRCCVICRVVSMGACLAWRQTQLHRPSSVPAAARASRICVFTTYGTRPLAAWPTCSKCTSSPRSQGTATCACCCVTTIRRPLISRGDCDCGSAGSELAHGYRQCPRPRSAP